MALLFAVCGGVLAVISQQGAAWSYLIIYRAGDGQGVGSLMISAGCPSWSAGGGVSFMVSRWRGVLMTISSRGGGSCSLVRIGGGVSFMVSVVVVS